MKRLVTTAIATFALLASGFPTAATSLVDVRLSCDDGTDLSLTVDEATATDLADSVTAMSLFPAGLVCSLAVLTTASHMPWAVASAYADPNGPKDFAVGGGQFFNQFVGCQENFAISAHVAADTPPTAPQAGAGGTVNFGFPESCPNPVWAGSRVVAKVDCVHVINDTTANFTAEITKTTGAFVTFFAGVTEIAFQVKDLNKTTPLFDEIVGQPTGAPCVFTAASSQSVFPVLLGNITVRNN